MTDGQTQYWSNKKQASCGRKKRVSNKEHRNGNVSKNNHFLTGNYLGFIPIAPEMLEI